MRVSTSLLILTFLSACSSNPVPVIQTEFIEVEVCEGTRIPVPGELTITEKPKVIPLGISYRELIQLLIEDRASLEVVNGRLEAIKELHGGER